MDIREYKEKDKEKVKDLLVELQKYIVEIDKFKLNIITKGYREKYFENVYHETYSNDGKIYVATEGDKLLGMISGFVCKYGELEKIGYKCPKKGIIAELIVSKGERTAGIGKGLLSTMENYLKSIGCEYLQLDVFAYNENAKQFYYNKGYTTRMETLFKKI